METNEFIYQLKDLCIRYKSWWCEPFHKFREDFMKAHVPFTQQNLVEFQQALKVFEEDKRKQFDLLADFYQFLDLNYEAYINATDRQRTEIRQVVADNVYLDRLGNPDQYLEDVLMRYVRNVAIKNLDTTGDQAWLVRGLIAISMENSGVDFRDSLTCLADLFVEAEVNGLNPQSDFENIARISSSEKPRGGPTSMQEMMANIGQHAIVKERRAIKASKSKS